MFQRIYHLSGQGYQGSIQYNRVVYHYLISIGHIYLNTAVVRNSINHRDYCRCRNMPDLVTNHDSATVKPK